MITFKLRDMDEIAQKVMDERLRLKRSYDEERRRYYRMSRVPIKIGDEECEALRCAVVDDARARARARVVGSGGFGLSSIFCSFGIF